MKIRKQNTTSYVEPRKLTHPEKGNETKIRKIIFANQTYRMHSEPVLLQNKLCHIKETYYNSGRNNCL
jgi:hypothetical protein